MNDAAEPGRTRLFAWARLATTLLFEMEQITYELETDEETKVIVITGAGNSWSAGMDLKQYFRETDHDPVARFRAMTAHRQGPSTNDLPMPTPPLYNRRDADAE